MEDISSDVCPPEKDTEKENHNIAQVTPLSSAVNSKDTEHFHEKDKHEYSINDDAQINEVNHEIVDESNTVNHENANESDATPAKRSRRTRKKPGLAEVPVCSCPLCNQALRHSELKAHLQWEVDRLKKYCRKQQKDCSNMPMTTSTSTSSRESSRPDSPVAGTSTSNATGSASGASEDQNEVDQATMAKLLSPQMRLNTFKEIKKNRIKRIQARRQRKPGEEDTTCPVCSDFICGTAEEIADHVDACLRQQEEDENAEIDIEGEDSNTGDGFEEYTWAGQTRVRSTTLLEGPIENHGFQKGVQGDEDEEVEVDVMEEGDVEYGQSQYNEADVIPCVPDELSESIERSALRRAVIATQGSSAGTSVSSRTQSSEERDHARTEVNLMLDIDDDILDDLDVEEERHNSSCENSSVNSSDKNFEEIIKSLKGKIKDQELMLKKAEVVKCLICMGPYKMPLTSVICWHVHCEDCWLRSLGTKKVCPQCNMITSPADLRRIFL